MVERKQVIAAYTVRCFTGMQPENLWRVCLHGLAKDYSTRLPQAGKGAPR